MTFQDYLKSLLKKYGVTQCRLCELIAIDPAHLSRMLRSDARFIFQPNNLEKIALFLGCTPDERCEIFRLAGKMPPEIITAFCKSPEAATKFRELAKAL